MHGFLINCFSHKYSLTLISRGSSYWINFMFLYVDLKNIVLVQYINYILINVLFLLLPLSAKTTRSKSDKSPQNVAKMLLTQFHNQYVTLKIKTSKSNVGMGTKWLGRSKAFNQCDVKRVNRNHYQSVGALQSGFFFRFLDIDP